MICGYVYLLRGPTKGHRPLKHANQLYGIKNALKWDTVYICMLTESWVIAKSIHKKWGLFLMKILEMCLWLLMCWFYTNLAFFLKKQLQNEILDIKWTYLWSNFWVPSISNIHSRNWSHGPRLPPGTCRRSLTWYDFVFFSSRFDDRNVSVIHFDFEC